MVHMYVSRRRWDGRIVLCWESFFFFAVRTARIIPVWSVGINSE